MSTTPLGTLVEEISKTRAAFRLGRGELKLNEGDAGFCVGDGVTWFNFCRCDRVSGAGRTVSGCVVAMESDDGVFLFLVLGSFAGSGGASVTTGAMARLLPFLALSAEAVAFTRGDFRSATCLASVETLFRRLR